MFSGNVITAELQSWNASAPMLVTLDGTTTASSIPHDMNKFSGMAVKFLFSGSVARVMFALLKNAAFPIVSTVSGSSTLERSHWLKAVFPMLFRQFDQG